MKFKIFLVMFVFAVTMIAVASMARADGVCHTGYRDTTAAERATLTSNLEAAKKALPAAPAGWAIVGDDKVLAPTSLCRDYERDPWATEHTRYYQRVDDQEAREKIMADAAAANAAAMKLKQPRLDAITAKMDKLTKTYTSLAAKGDTEGAAAIYTEITKAQEENEKILKEGNSEQQMAAAMDKASRDRTMNITLKINAGGETPGGGAKNLPLPAGARTAVYWLANGRDPHEERAFVLVGQWTPGSQGQWQPVRRAGAAVQAAHFISVNVVADSERLAPTVAAIDFKSLAAMLGH
jgi:hypothetical protein